MRWLAVPEVADEILVHAAANRWLVRVKGGRTAVLIRWKGTSGQTARVQFPAGGRATLKTEDVLSLQVPDPLIDERKTP